MQPTPDSRALGGLPFTREALYSGEHRFLCTGRWANADIVICARDGIDWVVKDFTKRSFLLRHLVGRFLIWREFRALNRLQGIPGIPRNPARISRWAVAYEYIEGRTLKEVKKAGESPGGAFFTALEEIIKRMHEHRVVHLDLRNWQNILVTQDGRPALLDFQTSFILDHVPRLLRKLFQEIDLSGVYKYWRKLSPESMSEDRQRRFGRVKRLRGFWWCRGYPMKTLHKRLSHWRKRRGAV